MPRVRVIYVSAPRGVKGSGPRRALHPCRTGTGNVHVAQPARSSAPTVRNPAMLEFLGFISLLLTLYIYILFAAAIMSWLIAFNVVNPRNQFVAMLADFLYRITEPVLRPVRALMPNLGGIDISPVIVILIIVFIQSVVLSNLAKAFI
jgi:YggT family protein